MFNMHQTRVLKLLNFVKSCRFKDTMLNTVGHRETELALQLGTLYTAEEALHIKMVDELAPLDQLMTRAHKEMEKWLQIPGTYHQIL